MPDLRLDRPFPALQKYMDSLDLETMDSKEHSHVPYVVILYKTLQQWNQRYGAPPKNYREKKDFIQLVKEGMVSYAIRGNALSLFHLLNVCACVIL